MSRLLTEAIRWSVFQTKNYGKAPKRSPTNRSRKVRLQSVKERTIKRTVCRCYSINQSNCRLLQIDQFTAPRLTAKSWIQTRSRPHAVQMSFAEKEAKRRYQESFAVLTPKTVLKSLLWTFNHAKNVPAKLRGRYQINFSKESKQNSPPFQAN